MKSHSEKMKRYEWKNVTDRSFHTGTIKQRSSISIHDQSRTFNDGGAFSLV